MIDHVNLAQMGYTRNELFFFMSQMRPRCSVYLITVLVYQTVSRINRGVVATSVVSTYIWNEIVLEISQINFKSQTVHSTVVHTILLSSVKYITAAVFRKMHAFMHFLISDDIGFAWWLRFHGDERTLHTYVVVTVVIAVTRAHTPMTLLAALRWFPDTAGTSSCRTSNIPITFRGRRYWIVETAKYGKINILTLCRNTYEYNIICMGERECRPIAQNIIII